MRAHSLDQHSHGDSAIHRLPAGGKLAAALLLAVGIALTPLSWWWIFALAAAVLLALAAAGRLPFGPLLRRLLWLEPLVLGVALLALLPPGGPALFATVLLRSSLCLLTMLLLASTTPFAALLAVLRRLLVPELLVTTLALMYRYLDVLADEAQRMARARRSRSFDRRRWPGWRVLATVLSQLFVRSVARAERIHSAMLARGLR
jgi:cobalt/nickel transport system permease protein